MALPTIPYKGTRDFYPEDMRFRNFMFRTIAEVMQRHGYEEYEAPLLEPTELYSAKTGDEIVNEQSYRFEDRGGRDVMIRPEMTPTVARMVAARRQELATPVRWYSITNYMRYERPQGGRLREFYQLNADIFGVKTIDADLEILLLAYGVMQAFGAPDDSYQIKINSRQLVVLIMADYLQLDATQTHSLTKLLDKKDKMSDETFSDAAKELFGEDSDEKMTKLTQLLDSKSLGDLPEELRDSQPIKEVQLLFTLLREHGIHNAVFDVTLMRGLDYYSDIVFEVFDTSPDNNRSLFGGGRYDGLVGLFGVEPIPTVGFAIGDVTLEKFLRLHDLVPELPSETDLYVVVIGDILRQAQGVATLLRQQGLNVAVDITDRKAEKQIKSAAKKGIKHVLFVGEQELQNEQFVLRNLDSGQEKTLSLSDIKRELGRE